MQADGHKVWRRGAPLVLWLLLLCVGAVRADPGLYGPPVASSAAFTPALISAPSFTSPALRPAPSFTSPALFRRPIVPILSDDREGPDAGGRYRFTYETGDGIYRQEEGVPLAPSGPVAAQGGWSFTFPDGTPAAFTFVADGDGFRVESDLVPTPPPLPAHALQQIQFARQQSASTPTAHRTFSPRLPSPSVASSGFFPLSVPSPRVPIASPTTKSLPPVRLPSPSYSYTSPALQSARLQSPSPSSRLPVASSTSQVPRLSSSHTFPVVRPSQSSLRPVSSPLPSPSIPGNGSPFTPSPAAPSPVVERARGTYSPSASTTNLRANAISPPRHRPSTLRSRPSLFSSSRRGSPASTGLRKFSSSRLSPSISTFKPSGAQFEPSPPPAFPSSPLASSGTQINRVAASGISGAALGISGAASGTSGAASGYSYPAPSTGAERLIY